MVDVALTESLFSMLESILPEYAYFGVVRERTGNIAHNSAPTNAYPCADGAEVCIAANTTRLAVALFRAIGRDDLADDPELGTDRGRVSRAAELDEAIGGWTRTSSSDEVVGMLRQLHIPVSRINSIADIVDDPQFRARDMVVAVEDPRLSRPLLVPGVNSAALPDTRPRAGPRAAPWRGHRARPEPPHGRAAPTLRRTARAGSTRA